jgi:two-component system, NarL family, response regulator DevR
MPETITAFLMDDHEVVRQGVRALLEATGEIVVVGEAGDAPRRPSVVSAPYAPRSPSSTCVVPDGNGMEVCREVRSSMIEHQLLDADVVQR